MIFLNLIPKPMFPSLVGFVPTGYLRVIKFVEIQKFGEVMIADYFCSIQKRGRESWDSDTEEKIHLASDYWEKVQYD